MRLCELRELCGYGNQVFVFSLVFDSRNFHNRITHVTHITTPSVS